MENRLVLLGATGTLQYGTVAAGVRRYFTFRLLWYLRYRPDTLASLYYLLAYNL